MIPKLIFHGVCLKISAKLERLLRSGIEVYLDHLFNVLDAYSYDESCKKKKIFLK